MQYGMIFPGGSATEQLQQAELAEEHGWDGVFVWEAAYGVDAWSLLAAMAARTTRVKLGTVLTPLPWRRPWKVASQVATVDQLSGGRAVLSIGIGAPSDDLPQTGEETGVRERAEMMDEGIDLMQELWRGGTSFHGRHYDYEGGTARDLIQVVAPTAGRIPIWVVGVWPRPKSMRRVLRCDGVVPQYAGGEDDDESADGLPAPDQVRALCDWLAENGRSDLDVIADGATPTDDPEKAAAMVAPLEKAGCTWWLETRWELPHHLPERMQEVRRRLEAGPPRT